MSKKHKHKLGKGSDKSERLHFSSIDEMYEKLHLPKDRSLRGQLVRVANCRNGRWVDDLAHVEIFGLAEDTGEVVFATTTRPTQEFFLVSFAQGEYVFTSAEGEMLRVSFDVPW